MDLSKLPVKVIVAVALVVLAASCFLFGLSYSRNQPFMMNGKEFGFGAGELQKRTAELENCQNEFSSVLTEARRQLTKAIAENEQLKGVNSALIAQQQARATQDAAMWFPIDDVQFSDDGTFSTQDGRREGWGKWSSPDSELALQLIEMNYQDVVVGTNLPPPGNKIRVSTQGWVSVPMNKWEYKLSVQKIHFGKVNIRIERRSKS